MDRLDPRVAQQLLQALLAPQATVLPAAEWRAQQAQSSSERVSSWDNPSYTRFPKSAADPLEQVFSDWETEDELNQLKRQMGQ